MAEAGRVRMRGRTLTPEVAAEPAAIKAARSAAVETPATETAAAAATTEPKRRAR